VLLVFLQCAWRPGGAFKSRDYWLTALWKSHTGKRLKEMLPDNIPVWVDNATPEVGDNPDAVFPPDPVHMAKVIDTVQPRVILACGEVAQKGLDLLEVPYIPSPHPAYRALPKTRTAEIKSRVEEAYEETTV